MHDLPTDWTALCALVFLLGMRHGFDADHLATIDGLTRLTRRRGGAFARWCGALFSLGHGAVVLAIAALVGSASERWVPPEWVDDFGAAVSIAFLLGLGIFNLRAVLAAAPGEMVAPVGLKGRWLGRLAHEAEAIGRTLQARRTQPRRSPFQRPQPMTQIGAGRSGRSPQ